MIVSKELYLLWNELCRKLNPFDIEIIPKKVKVCEIL
jgi:hypothetical protein